MRVGRLAEIGLNFFFPLVCLGCRQEVSSHGMLCAHCWPMITNLSLPFCPSCACPLPFSVLPHVLCGVCLRDPPPFQQVRAVFVYAELSKKLLLCYKDRSGIYLAPLFARWMVEHGSDILAQADILIPIPLHWKRLICRGYNQSALLANSIAAQTGIEVQVNWLKKLRATPPQGTLSAKARHENMKRVFSIKKEDRRGLVGKRIVVVDDVMSSGATMRSAAEVLLRAGAKQVDGLVVARAQL